MKKMMILRKCLGTGRMGEVDLVVMYSSQLLVLLKINVSFLVVILMYL